MKPKNARCLLFYMAATVCILCRADVRNMIMAWAGRNFPQTWKGEISAVVGNKGGYL